MPMAAARMTPESSNDDAEDTRRDHALMVRIANGDHEAFRDLLHIHQNAVVGTVARMLGSTSDAEDIAQQVFLRVWRYARRYKPDAKFTTYLFTITRNLVFNEIRRRSRKREVSSDELTERTHRESATPSHAGPDAEMLQAELQQAIDDAIAALPEAQRLAVVLRRYENMPYEEIARVLNVTVPSVKSLLFRARTSLRESLAIYLDARPEFVS